jgi:hypothetical protein
MKSNTVLGVLVCSVLSLPVYTEAQQPATFHGEISDSQCAFNVHSLTKSHAEMLKSKSGVMGSSRSSCSLYCIEHMGGKFVLASKNHVYHLDNQELPRGFVGEKVKLRGILDPKTDIIQVVGIDRE